VRCRRRCHRHIPPRTAAPRPYRPTICTPPATIRSDRSTISFRLVHRPNDWVQSSVSIHLYRFAIDWKLSLPFLSFPFPSFPFCFRPLTLFLPSPQFCLISSHLISSHLIFFACSLCIPLPIALKHMHCLSYDSVPPALSRLCLVVGRFYRIRILLIFCLLICSCVHFSAVYLFLILSLVLATKRDDQSSLHAIYIPHLIPVSLALILCAFVSLSVDFFV
jgi:hypothetical protein